MEKISFLIIILLGIVGCSQKGVVNFDNNSTLIIEQRVGEELSSNYEVINEIDDEELVQKVIDIFKSARWETNVDVNMPREPDYKINRNYLFWVTPKGNMLEMIVTENSYYVRLTESQSSRLFTIMTGKEL